MFLCIWTDPQFCRLWKMAVNWRHILRKRGVTRQLPLDINLINFGPLLFFCSPLLPQLSLLSFLWKPIPTPSRPISPNFHSNMKRKENNLLRLWFYFIVSRGIQRGLEKRPICTTFNLKNENCAGVCTVGFLTFEKKKSKKLYFFDWHDFL